MDVFIQKIIEVKHEILERIKENKDIVIMRAHDWKDFKTAKKCFICGKGDKKLRHHCQFTGKYRGCAHDDCNLQFSIPFTQSPFSFITSRTMTVI